MAITKEQISDIKSCVMRLVECELAFDWAGKNLNDAKRNLEYQYVQAQKEDKK